MGASADMSEDSRTLSLAAYLLCAAVFLVLMFYSLHRIVEPLNKIQVAPLRTRLYWAVKANVYICFMSAFLHILHITNFEYIAASALGPHVKVVKPIEYLLTCPMMMLCTVILGGEAVPQKRQMEATGLTAIVLVSGFFASMSLALSVKMMFFVFGCLCFLMLMQRLAKIVWEHSGGKESLFRGGLHGSVFKHLCLKLVSTWVLFPVWWLLSAEGMDIISDPDANTIVTAALNIFAKGAYVVYVQSIHDKYIGESNLMEHPAPRSHEHLDAHYAAARLGPAGAIAMIERTIEQEMKRMSIIKQILAEEEGLTNASKDALADLALSSPRSRTSSVSSAPDCGLETGDGVLRRNSKTAPVNGQDVSWEALVVLVTRMCRKEGADARASEILDILDKGHVRSIQELQELQQKDLDSLGMPIGLRRQLLAMAHETNLKSECDDRSPRSNPGLLDISSADVVLDVSTQSEVKQSHKNGIYQQGPRTSAPVGEVVMPPQEEVKQNLSRESTTQGI